MRTYNLLNKKIKLGLITCGLYAATSLIIPDAATSLTAPFLANHTEKPAVQQSNPEQIHAPEQAETIYKQKLAEYASDKKITSDEIKELVDAIEPLQSFLFDKRYEIKIKRRNLIFPPDFNLKRQNIEDEIFKLENQFYDVSKKKEIINRVYELEADNPYYGKIQTLENMITNLASKKIYKSPSLEKIKRDLENEILCYFPLLLEKPLFYSASEPIERKLNPVMENLVKSADEFFKKYYQDTRLGLLVEKETYNVKDILMFYNFIHKERKDVCFNLKEINQEKRELETELEIFKSDEKLYLKNRSLRITNLKEKIKAIEAEGLQYKKEKKLRITGLVKKFKVLENKRLESRADNNIRIQNLEKNISNITSQILKLEKGEAYLDGYSNRQERIKEFITDNGDLNKYWGLSIYSVNGGFLEYVDLKDTVKNFDKYNSRAISGLDGYFKAQGFDVEVETLKNPAKTMFPWSWGWNMLFGFLFPTFRNILTAKLIRREVDSFDIVEGVLESLFFPTLFDGAFPLMYPLRLLGVPFVMEPIRAITKFRSLK